ncbi:Dehydration-responsive element-binding protein 3 [Abeliophyllum distichum]|uniref:Dehydration-responsive element-binding protein 3 n=1 Tax=Abeliophyllum distichum TaxID=126358 RepID=A0ABD1Q6N6_9LAMI
MNTEPKNSDNNLIQKTHKNPENSVETTTKKIKRIRESATNVKHPVYRGVRMRNWGKWVSELSYDVAALSIKGSSAILNFPELAAALLSPVLLSLRDVKAAAAKAAAMQKFDLIESPSSSSSSLLSLVSSINLSTSSEELSQIVELPKSWILFRFARTEE